MPSLQSITISLEIIGLLIFFNYSTTWVSKMYDALISIDYWSSKGQRQTWNSVLVVVMIQKLGIVGLCFCGMVAVKKMIKKQQNVRLEELPTSEHEDNESYGLNGKCYRVETSEQQSDKNTQSISFKISLQLGFLLFLSIILFTYLQSTVNIIHIIIQKSISSIILYLLTQFSTIQQLKLSKIISCVIFCAVVGLSILVKLVFNQMEGFYSAQLGAMLEEIDVWRCFALLAMIGLDITLYWKISEVVKSYESSNQGYQSQCSSVLSTLHRTFQLLFSTTKYCLILLVLFTLFTSQLFQSIQFIQHHTHLISLFVHLSLFHFLNQFITFYIINKFSMKFFLFMMITNGVWTKMGSYFTNNFDIHSLVFLGLGFCVLAVVKNEVSQKTERMKNE